MPQYLYEVRLVDGLENPDYQRFRANMENFDKKPVSPDINGFQYVFILSHHMDENTVYQRCTIGLTKKLSVIVTEITKETLNSSSSLHATYFDTTKRHFLPLSQYPNIL